MSRYYEPLIWHQRGIRSHSVFNDRSHAMPVRRHEPVYITPRSSAYGSYHDYGIDDSINRADYLSNAVLEDTFEAAARSRGKDHALLRNLNAAIVSTERHVNPRVAVVSRRVRASSVPPVARPFSGHYVQPQLYSQVVEPQLVRQSPARPVVIFLAPNTNDAYASHNLQASTPVVLAPAEAPWYLRARAGSVPPPEPRRVRSSSVPPGYLTVQPVYHPLSSYVTGNLWAHRPVPLRSNIVRTARARSLEPSYRPQFYAGSYYQPSIPSTQLWAHRPRILRKDYGRIARARSAERESNPGRLSRSVSVPHIYERASDYYQTIPNVQERALSRYLYAHRGRFGPDSRPVRPSLGTFPQMYVPWKGYGPSNRSKAAVIGTRLEADNGVKPLRRPRSEFAASKLRELKREEIEEGIYYSVPVSSALHASRPPLPKPTDRKSIRDLDGFTRPKNLLSWQYRVESRLSPNDLIYEPASYSRMRQQVKDVQGKMDRQRQLLDRYLDSDFKIPAHTSHKMTSRNGRSTVWPSVTSGQEIENTGYPLQPTFDAETAQNDDESYRPNMFRPQSRSTQQVSSLSRASASVSARHVTATSSRSTTAARPDYQARPAYVASPQHHHAIRQQPLPPVKIEAPKPITRTPAAASTQSVGGSSVKIPGYYAAGGDPNNLPVSELRRKLRRTIARAKNNPDYYRE